MKKKTLFFTVTNDLGSNFIIKSDYIIVCGVGVDEAILEESMSVYPNPAQGSFTLDLGHTMKDVQVNVIDTKGKVVYQRLYSGEHNKMLIDLSDYPAGIYMLRVQSGDIHIDRKVTMVK